MDFAGSLTLSIIIVVELPHLNLRRDCVSQLNLDGIFTRWNKSYTLLSSEFKDSYVHMPLRNQEISYT